VKSEYAVSSWASLSRLTDSNWSFMHFSTIPTANDAGEAHEEVLALQAQNRSLQLLVGELLFTNQQLRAKLAKHEPAHGAAMTAAPQPV
jgi:hypothetical protein